MKKTEEFYQKRNRLSRGRGYAFEDWLVNEFQSIGWSARRLGGSSTGLPDIVATNHDPQYPRLLSIECKSGKLKQNKEGDGYNAHHLYIEQKQVQRCIDVAQMFDAYHADVMFSFKFSFGTSKSPLIYHFLMDNRCYDVMDRFHSLSCNSAGKCEFSWDAGFIDPTSMEIDEWRRSGSIILQPYHLNKGIVYTPGSSVSAGFDSYPYQQKADQEFNAVLGMV